MQLSEGASFQVHPKLKNPNQSVIARSALCDEAIFLFGLMRRLLRRKVRSSQ
jgi:hypothetical protein